MIKKAIVLLIFTMMTFCGKAQNVITIEECQQLAVAQSSANVQKELNEQLLQVKLNDAASHYYPNVEIEGGIGYFSQLTELPSQCPGYQKMPHDMYSISLHLQQVVFDGLQATYGRKRERLLNKNEINKLDISINKIKEQVISIYLNLLIIEKQITILSNVEKNLQEQNEQLKALLKAGVVYGNSIAQLDVEKLKIQQQKDELQATKESLISSLSILTGKNLSDATFAVPKIKEIEKTTASTRCEFDIFKNEKANLDYLSKMHLSKSLPKISFFALGGYGRPTFNLLNPNLDWSYAVGLQFKIPLIDWARSKGVSDIIVLQKAILESQESDFTKANQIAIQEKINEILKIEHQLLLDDQIISKYQEIKQTASTQLLNGTITIFDFLKQQHDETQSIIAKEVHSIQLLKTQYELLALKGQL